MGDVRRNFSVRVTFCPLTCLGIVVGRFLSAKLRRNYLTELDKERQFKSDDGIDSDNAYAW